MAATKRDIPPITANTAPTIILPYKVYATASGLVVGMVGDNPLWHAHLPQHLTVTRSNLDQLCVFLLRWGFADVAQNMSFWSEGVSDEVLQLLNEYSERKHFIYGCRGDEPPISLDTGRILWQVRDRLGRDHVECYKMGKELTDAEFVVEYMIHMLSYNVPATCCVCYRKLDFWLDCRMIAGPAYCPLCFPEAAMKVAAMERQNRHEDAAVYWERAATLLPRRFMAPEPPPKYLELRPQP